jgi:hypothetical protein
MMQAPERFPGSKAPGRGDAGAGEEIRTPDPRITNALLYQLSYAGTGTEHPSFGLAARQA